MDRSAQVHTPLSVDARLSPRDDWDEFVASCPGDTYKQSTAYAAITYAWGDPRDSPVRYVELRRGGELVAGVQMMLRPVGRFGTVGYVAGGPVLADESTGVADGIVQGMLDFARRERVRVIVIQPVAAIPVLDAALRGHGFGPAPAKVTLTSSIEVDLQPTEDELLARMRAGLRRNIRKAERSGVVVTRADRSRLHEFAKMHAETAKRNNFTPASMEQVFMEWDVLHPRGLTHLFLAERDGVPLSGATVTMFGDRAVFRYGGWFRSSESEALRPNDILHWRIMQWAKSAGFAAYDLGHFDDEAAATLLRGDTLPQSFRSSYSHFKLGYGGDVRVLPPPVWRVVPKLLHPMQPLAERSLLAMPRLRDAVRSRAVSSLKPSTPEPATEDRS